jgi:hypothetical protein
MAFWERPTPPELVEGAGRPKNPRQASLILPAPPAASSSCRGICATSGPRVPALITHYAARGLMPGWHHDVVQVMARVSFCQGAAASVAPRKALCGPAHGERH